MEFVVASISLLLPWHSHDHFCTGLWMNMLRFISAGHKSKSEITESKNMCLFSFNKHCQIPQMTVPTYILTLAF